MKRTIKALTAAVGGLSTPSKMPGWSYGLPAWECKTGAILRQKAGSVCSKCYALKGMYSFRHVKEAQVRRLEIISLPGWAEDMTALLSLKYRNRKRRDRVFRWHDSGDLQNVRHLSLIVQVAKNIPSIRFWLPTHERKIVRSWLNTNPKGFPANLTVRVSAAMIGQSAKHFPGIHASTVGYNGGRQCPAYLQGGECKDCRVCWDKRIPSVNYPQH